MTRKPVQLALQQSCLLGHRVFTLRHQVLIEVYQWNIPVYASDESLSHFPSIPRSGTMLVHHMLLLILNTLSYELHRLRLVSRLILLQVEL